MRRFGLLLMALGLVWLGVPAAAHGQCTAPQNTQAVKAMAEAVRGVAWPLPVPRNTRIHSLEDLRGALLLAGSVYQIERIVWQITPEGSLDVLELEGYTRDGLRTQFAKKAGTGRRVESVADLTGFDLGNPGGKGRLFQVESIELGTDRQGFLSIAAFQGVDRRTLDSVSYQDGKAACGLRIAQGCNSSNCTGGACGASPGCPCNGTSGACSGTMESVCSGDCPEGRECNGSVADCRCERKPVVVPGDELPHEEHPLPDGQTPIVSR